MVSLRPTFGYRGSTYGVIVLIGINFGWVGILASLAGSAMEQVADNVGGGFTFAADYTIYAIGIGIVLPLVIIMFSQKAAFLLSKIAVPILLLFVAYILFRLISGGYIARIAATEGDGTVSWPGAFEIIFAFSISWFTYLGAWNRFSRTERIGFWGTFLGLSSTGILFAVVGGMATLATGEIDPALWSNQLDLGISALVIIALGSGSMGILSMLPNINYRWVCAAVTLPSIVFVYATSLQDLFNLMLIFVGLLGGPYWAVSLVDYFFVRKQRINVRACYEPRGAYRYTGGFNLLAFGCVAVGMAAWLFLGGWQSGIAAITFPAGQELFEYVSATLPSMVISGLLYYVTAPAFFKNRATGDYKQEIKKTDNPVPEQAQL